MATDNREYSRELTLFEIQHCSNSIREIISLTCCTLSHRIHLSNLIRGLTSPWYNHAPRVRESRGFDALTICNKGSRENPRFCYPVCCGAAIFIHISNTFQPEFSHDCIFNDSISSILLHLLEHFRPSFNISTMVCPEFLTYNQIFRCINSFFFILCVTFSTALSTFAREAIVFFAASYHKNSSYINPKVRYNVYFLSELSYLWNLKN